MNASILRTAPNALICGAQVNLGDVSPTIPTDYASSKTIGFDLVKLLVSFPLCRALSSRVVILAMENVLGFSNLS